MLYNFSYQSTELIADNCFMPSGKIHDAITFLIAAPTFAAVWGVTKSLPIAFIVTFGMIFGGLMFGPDLDTRSTQYSRWSIFRFLWYPYQAFFAHRSRWSHGFIFGTLLRVVYFMGVLTLLSFLGSYILAAYMGATIPNLTESVKIWQQIGEFTHQNFGEYFFLYVFVGLWLGGASHSLADIAGTFIKTGRI
ncbi:MAG: metal-binding protein [Pyrinomonadaceae bacterium]